MFDRPRNWKWMVPAALITPLMLLWNVWSMAGEPWRVGVGGGGVVRGVGGGVLVVGGVG